MYDATIAALVEKNEAYKSPEHLRAALHRGIKLRALRLHRDREVHEKALEHAAPAMEAAGQDRAWREEPERTLLARDDDAIVGEFIAELTDIERQVFTLVADGRSWRAIATALALSETEARTLTRTCERKRSRFLTLYETGRLCGCRSQTIGSLLSGKEDSERAVGQALTHLRHCQACQIRHKTDAASLRDARALAVLPLPAYASAHASLLEQFHTAASRVARFQARGIVIAHRQIPRS
jgi:DNA-directed RNA polymerase specialized sigma24 family protein